MNESFTETLRTIYGFGSLAALGYFMWVLRELTKDIKESRSKLDTLVSEHNTYKELHKCPLINGAEDGNKTHHK